MEAKQRKFHTAEAELVRRKYHYRRLILCGRMKLPYVMIKPLIGPDCAYHAYRNQ